MVLRERRGDNTLLAWPRAVVLNIGYDLGFIPQNVFTMLVIMAVVTTVMTGPLHRALLPRAGYAVPAGIEA